MRTNPSVFSISYTFFVGSLCRFTLPTNSDPFTHFQVFIAFSLCLYGCIFNSETIRSFYASAIEVFENTVGKEEIPSNKQFLLSPLFSTRSKSFLPFSTNLKLSSANSFNLEESKMCRLKEA